MPAQLPEAIRRLDRYLATARIAHEAIWELHSMLLAAGRDDQDTHEQLREAGLIATVEIPDLLRMAGTLRTTWSDQELLDRAAAEVTAGELAAELDRVEPEFRRLRARQDAIARAFHVRVGGKR